EALHVDAPLLLPRKAQIGELRDQRLGLADRNKALIDHLVGIVEANGTPPERHRIDGPLASFFGDGALLPIPPGAAAFALEQRHRQPRAAEDRRRVDVGERRLERRQGGKRTSCGGGGNLFASGIVIVIAIVVVIITHVLSLSFWKVSSASENDRASSFRPRTGTRTFSLRTRETPERRETINSVGTFRPRALARSSTCLGERRVSAMTSLRARPRRTSAPIAASSLYQRRSARPAESA